MIVSARVRSLTAVLVAVPMLCAAQAAKPAASTPRTGGVAPTAASQVSFSHLRVRTKDVDAAKKFWVAALGGTSRTVGTTEAVMLPGVLVLLDKQNASGGSKGSIVDHVTLEVKDLKALMTTLKQQKVTLATRAEINTIYVVTDDMAFMPDRATSAAVAMTDDVKVELVENKQLTTAVAFKSFHFAPPVMADVKDWYVKAFGAKLGNRGFGFESLDLGGRASALMFTLANEKVAPTSGRALDRIGFEVRGAALLAKKIERLGGAITRPYGKSPDTGVVSVIVTDPWGTSIELTEGLKLSS